MMLFSMTAGAGVDGTWVTPSRPGWLFILEDGRGEPLPDAIGMAVLRPNLTDWEIFFGPQDRRRYRKPEALAFEFRHAGAMEFDP
jgi:hypothetical protein